MTKRRGLTACAVLLCGMSVVRAAPMPQAPAGPKVVHKAPTRAERLAELEAQLSKAEGAHAASLRESAESLRLQGLKGGTRLLLQSADAALSKRDFQAAERYLTTALALQDDQPILRRQRGALRLAAGDFDGAVEDLLVCTTNDAADTQAWSLLIDAELQRHQPELAWNALQSLKMHDPSAPGLDKVEDTVKHQRDGQED
ncbi:tetratricopeptide repeat protein [Neokomagataea tanensis]|nr:MULTISPECIES: hypothetical protein [Neokomagataea]